MACKIFTYNHSVIGTKGDPVCPHEGRQWYGLISSFYTPNGQAYPGLGMVMVRVEVPKLPGWWLVYD